MASNQTPRPYRDWPEGTKEKHREWTKQNRLRPSTNVPKDIGEEFRRICKQEGRTMNSVLATYIRSVVDESHL